MPPTQAFGECRVMFAEMRGALLFALLIAFFDKNKPHPSAHPCGPLAARIGDAVVLGGVAADCRRVVQWRLEPETLTLMLEGGNRLFSALEPALDRDFGTGDLINHSWSPLWLRSSMDFMVWGPSLPGVLLEPV